MSTALFQNKVKNIFCVIFSLLSIINCVWENLPILSRFAPPHYVAIPALDFALTLFFNIPAPLCMILLVFLSKKEFRGKSLIAPVCFGIKCITSLMLSFVIGSLLAFDTEVTELIGLLFVFLQGAAVIFMFIGTLSDFLLISWFKAGGILFIVSFLATMIIDLVSSGLANTVFSSFERGLEYLLGIVFNLLFYVGILMIASEDKRISRDEI